MNRSASGEHVGQPPGGGRADQQRERDGRQVAADPQPDDGDAAGGDPEADELPAAWALPQGQEADDQGEAGRALQQDRGQAGGHAGVQAPVQQGVLDDTEHQADRDHPAPPDPGPPQDQEGGERRAPEPQRVEQQRRDRLQPDVQEDEVGPPDGGDEQGQEEVAGFHAPEPARRNHEAPVHSSSGLI
jgi:hypothetical protein